ncbi:MAG: hypothetical protein J6B68_11725 [Lachnospiraceae bacterium]|nr:hypothetical protein [Lachnospiraceae bacterium]
MSVTSVGNNVVGTDYQQYQKSDEVLFKTYSYQEGKEQEKVYYKKDCVELSLESYMIPATADNYEEVRSILKTQSGGKIISPGNRFFSETYEIMRDYYDKKITCDEVKNIFKEYVYHAFGRPEETQDNAETADEAKVVGTSMSTYEKQRFTGWLSGLYEYFSRANTRNACTKNMQEGKALIEENGINWNGTYYYNSDWYYACEEMQKMFQETANELTDEYGAEQVDFTYVEQHTRFTLDGGITFNGVWDSMEWQINRDRAIGGSFHDVNMAPPEDFVYCSNATWDGENNLDSIKEYFENERKESPFMMFLLAATKNTDAKDSLLLNQENYLDSSEWEENATYQSTISFLKNFNIAWNFRSNRFEFLKEG